jgi:hypothetical protein
LLIFTLIFPIVRFAVTQKESHGSPSGLSISPSIALEVRGDPRLHIHGLQSPKFQNTCSRPTKRFAFGAILGIGLEAFVSLFCNGPFGHIFVLYFVYQAELLYHVCYVAWYFPCSMGM